jgi:hypothetical protein
MAVEHPHAKVLIEKLRRGPDEASDDYLGRMQRELPQVPPDVLADWCRPQVSCVLESTAWLDHRCLSFTLAQWPTRRFQEVSTVNPKGIACWRDLFAAGDEDLTTSELGQFMLRHGTWPRPPCVLIGGRRRVGPLLLRRRHLFAGHHRLAYLLAMAKEPSWILLPEHQVWEVRQIQH